MRASTVYSLSVAATLLLLSPGCEQDKPAEDASNPKSHLVPSTVNPNGDSPLALVMRRIREQTNSNREALLAGKNGSVIDGSGLKTALPTDPQTQSKVFFQFADQYLGAAKKYNQLVKQSDSSAEDKKSTFNTMVTTCAACHKVLCPGPLVVIDKLLITQ